MTEYLKPRFAHTEGYTVLRYSADGGLLITGGSDSLVRAFQTEKSKRHLEAITLESHKEAVLSLGTSDDKLLSSDEEGRIVGHTISQNEAGEYEINSPYTVYRSVLPVWDIRASFNNMQTAIAAESGEINIVSLLDTSVLSTIKDSSGPINSIDYNDDGTKIISNYNDGTVKLWDVGASIPICIHKWDKVSAVCQPGVAGEQVKIRWEPGGELVAVPNESGEVILISTVDFSEKTRITTGIKRPITSLEWSPNADYLGIVIENQVQIWDMHKIENVASYKHSENVCSVAWNPTNNELAFTDEMGALVIWDDVVDMPNLQSRSHKKALKKNGDDYGENNDFVMDMDDDGGRDGDGERNNNNLVSNLFDDESKENRQMELEDELGAESIAETEDEMEDFVVDDDGGGYVEPALKKQLYEATRVVPFQPSATPWIGNKSYLAFNTVGTVTTTLVNDSHNSIEIEFFDKMAHRDIRFSDPYKFSMASLSKIGCLFGKNPKREDNEDNGGDSTSVILYRAFKGWAGQSDWTFRLPPGEYIQCLALSEGGAAIFTTERLVRFITIGGIQSWIESVPQNIVSCVAGKKMLFCVHQREGITASTMGSSKHDINGAQIGDPVYDWELRRIDNGRKISCGVCPVSHNSRLCWLGFSDENQPLTCDSSGVLRMLVRYTSFLNASWVPVFDAKAVATERKKLENYWPVGVSGLNFMVVIVKDKNNYPPISKPVVTELELKIPMIQPDSATSKEEQKYLLQAIMADALKSQKTILDSGMSAKYAMFSDINGSLTLEMESRREDTEDADIELDKLLLNSIHVACRNNKVMRALDLVGMLRLAESLLAAEKIAVFHKNAVLAEKIMEVRSKFSALSDEDADENSENEESDEESDQNQTGYARDTARLGTVNFTQDHRSSLSNKNLDLAKKAKSGLSHRDLAEADHHMFSVDTQPTVSGQNQYPGTQTDSDLTTTAHLNSSLVGHTDSDISALPGYSPKAKGSKRSVNAAFNPFAVENSTQSSIISKRDGRSSHSYDSNTKDLTNSVTSSNPFDPPVRSRTDSTLIDSSKPTKKPKTYSKLKTQESELSKEFEARTNLSSNTPSTKTLNLLASFAGPKPKKFSSKTTGDTLNGTTAEDSVDLESVQGTPSTVGDSNGL